MFRVRLLAIAAVGSFAFTARVSAVPSVGVDVNSDNVIPSVVANAIYADGGGIDWTGAALTIDLTSGSTYQNEFGSDTPPIEGFFDLFPELEFDTYVGIIGDGTAGIAGGAGTLSGGLLSLDAPQVSTAWFNTSKLDTGSNKIGNISLTDDASGTWSIAVTFAYLPNLVFLNNPIVNGEMVWDPLHGDLGADGFVGIADLSSVLSQWNQVVPAGSVIDPSGDGFVGIEDLNTVLGNWNAGLVPLVPGLGPGWLQGDMDNDGFVGLSDLNIWMSNWNLNVPPGDPRADPSGDGFVGIEDKMTGNWGAGTPPAPAPGVAPPAVVVPEPASLSLLGALGFALFKWVR